MRLRSRHRRHRVLNKARLNKQAAQSYAVAARQHAGNAPGHHHVLARQLKKLGLDPAHPPQCPAAWQHFLERIDRAYQGADQDRYLLERSLAISSREMQELYDNLQLSSESRLRAERNKLRAVISAVGAGLCTLDLEGRVLSINPEAQRLLGCTEDDLLGSCFFDRVEASWNAAAVSECTDTKMCALIASGQPYHEANGAFLRKDNTVFPVSYTLNPIFDEGTLRGAVLVFFDLSQRKQAEAALRESEQRFRDLFESSPDAIFVEDFEGNVLDVNPAACALHGLDRAQMVGRNVATLVPEAQREQVAREFARLVAGEVKQVEGYSLNQQGRAVPVEIRVSHILYSGQPALLLHVHDITERKRAEAALRESEQRHRSLLEHLPVGVYRTTPEGRFIEANTATARLFGIEDAAALQQYEVKAFYVDLADREQHLEQLEQRDQPANTPAEFQLRRPNSEVIWVRDYAQAVRNGKGEVVFYDGILLDITEQKHAKEALQESERRYRTIVEHASEAIVVFDVKTGCFVDSNANAEALYDLPREALYQTGLVAMSPERQPDGRLSAEVAREEIMRAVEGEVRVFEWMHQNARGWEVPCEMRLVRIPSADRVLVRCSITDITERKQIEKTVRESEERYRTIVEHAAEAIVVFDVESGLFIDSNAHAEALYGLSREALHQTGPAALSPAFQPDGCPSAEAAHEQVMRAIQGGVCVFDWIHCNAQGREIPCEVRLVRLPSAEGRLLVRGSITDITERKRFEKEIIKAREKAEEMSHLKSTFLNNMSHEIRTPLTAIIGFSAILAEETSSEQRELVDLIEQSGKRLLNTLNAVLDLSMLETGGVSLDNEWFDLVEAAQGKIAAMQLFAREKNLALEFATPVPRMPVHLDRACLDRILTHLVDNAIKFTHEGRVTVQLVREAERVGIRVEDTGVGISNGFRPFLFDDFKQESTGLARSHEGAGLGLAVTRRMVNLMGGTISVESAKGKGSVFEVSFAQPTIPNGAAKTSSTPEADQPKPCILVVEDTPEIEMLVECMLSDAYAVTTTPNEEGALELAQQRRFDLVLMDINLGSARTGVDVMDAMRKLPDYKSVPIVAMTAYALLEDRTRFLEAGFDGYLSKPFTAHQAIDTIRQLLSVNGSV